MILPDLCNLEGGGSGRRRRRHKSSSHNSFPNNNNPAPAAPSSSSSPPAKKEFPEHVLKVFRAPDQTFKFLLVHKETTAREVVMLALQEFG